MSNSLYETAVVVKIFHNKNLQKIYLPGLLTGIFSDITKRKIMFLMIQLSEKKRDITIPNMLLIQDDSNYRDFLRKIKSSKLSEAEIADVVYNFEIDSSEELFKESFENLHITSFLSKATEISEDIKYYLGYSNVDSIIYQAKKMLKIHEVIFGSKTKQRGSQITDAFNSINLTSAFIKTSSENLNRVIGGHHKGYPTTIAARPSHGKSTWLTYDSIWQVYNTDLHIDIIGAEEAPEAFWRRIFAAEFDIPINQLTSGERKITESELKRVKEKYESRVTFHSKNNLKEITRTISSLKDNSYIGIDHVNSIEYPSGDDYRGIKHLVGFEKEWLVSNKSSVILNLTQVNTKKMQFQKRLFPDIEDAYMSSVLEHASRVFLIMYYPYKDYVSPEFSKRFAGKPKPSQELVHMKIAKHSLGDIGTIDFRYEYEYGRYKDLTTTLNPEVQALAEPELDFTKFIGA